ncbi:MAG: alkaline phosphatase family protein, partial [Bdellovibrio sp.]
MNRFLFVVLVILSSAIYAEAASGKYFDRVIFVLFENSDYDITIKQPFFKKLASKGANFTNFLAHAHPSQGNYIVLTSGDLNGVKNDGNYDLNVKNIVDLLENKGISWKVYAEGYPGDCFRGARYGHYRRRHNPFISYVNIQNNSRRCAQIVNASEFDKDVATGKLPDYVFYVPDLLNDGHNTGVAYADKWYAKKFGPYIANSKFMHSTILISTFDENNGGKPNRIYTSIVGPKIRAGVYREPYNLA